MHRFLRVGCWVLFGAYVVACTSSDGNGSDASTDQTIDTTTADSQADVAGDALEDALAIDAGVNDGCVADVGCPTMGTLHPPKGDAGTSTLFCPFSASDGGQNVSCNPSSQHCCEGQSGACTPKATACTSSDVDWTCADPNADCPGNAPVCCGRGAFVSSSGANCGNGASCFTGTYCATACQPSEIILCTSTSECPSNKTCTPFSMLGNQVGACR